MGGAPPPPLDFASGGLKSRPSRRDLAEDPKAVGVGGANDHYPNEGD